MSIRSGSDDTAGVRARAHRSSRTAAAAARRTGRRALAIPHSLITMPGRRPSPADATSAAAAVASTPDGCHTAARARRIREVHIRTRNHVCGLCLAAWPCPQVTWASDALKATG